MTTSIEDVTAALESTKVSLKGLSFEGRSLKLNTEDEAKPVVDAITNFTDLEYLNMEGNTLGVDAAKAIAKALEKHPKFKKALWKDMFTGRMKTEIPKALEFLGDGLVKAGARLTELDLSDNAFGPIGVEGLVSLLRSSTCYALEELRLNNNGLGITGGKLLAIALLDCYNSSKQLGKPLALKVFVAGRNRLENEGANALAQVFKTIGTLEEVVMPQNGIWHMGIAALSDAFTYNTNLQILNLNDNTIGAQGAKAIAHALPNLQKLKQINFGDCLLKTKGALLLAQALKRDHTDLEELVLGFNEIAVQGGIAVVDAIANKSRLKSLVLDGNQFNAAGRDKIKQKLKEIGKFNVLSSLDECDSEEDSEDDSTEDSAESEENEESDNLTQTMISLTLAKTSSLTSSVDNYVNYEKFSKNPTVENFLALGDNREDFIFQIAHKNPDSYLDDIFPILMKVSALSIDKSEQATQSAFECSERLYKDLFMWAQKNGKLSLVNNALLVHLGLIKSEDKKFKPSWNIQGCLMALEKISDQKYIPASTKDTLRVFLNRELERKGEFLKLKQQILNGLS